MALAHIGMPVQHADAFQKILAVTCRAWGLEPTAQTADVRARRGTDGVRRPRQGRSAYFARLAARAFEAQVMALRCRQAFVGQSG